MSTGCVVPEVVGSFPMLQTETFSQTHSHVSDKLLVNACGLKYVYISLTLILIKISSVPVVNKTESQKPICHTGLKKKVDEGILYRQIASKCDH